ncbi:hypothetical protein NPIL_364701 [Nephila pilipes]|uniref:Uncharacterized protein n=1 Tax=Nephila pilipes TaxID=299642 RepID=A0A8X6PUU4_NEPPI|nr:hypothetical protein NPIL_364701 [Nephila pilipes]
MLEITSGITNDTTDFCYKSVQAHLSHACSSISSWLCCYICIKHQQISIGLKQPLYSLKIDIWRVMSDFYMITRSFYQIVNACRFVLNQANLFAYHPQKTNNCVENFCKTKQQQSALTNLSRWPELFGEEMTIRKKTSKLPGHRDRLMFPRGVLTVGQNEGTGVLK